MSSNTTSRRSRAPTPLVAINSLVIDVSGSTYSMGDAPMEQIHELMTKLKEDAITNNTNIRLSLHTFNGTVRQVIPTNPTELSVDMRTYTVPSLATIRDILRPGGSTALYDAGIQGLDHIEKIYEQEWNKLPKAVRSLNPTITKCYVLATDGLDNQSTHSISDFKTRTLVAKKNNVQTIALTSKNSPLAKLSDVVLHIDAPLENNLHIPMTSRLAHLAIIDILSATVQARFGSNIDVSKEEVIRNIEKTRV